MSAPLHEKILTPAKKTILFAAGSLSQAFQKVAGEALNDQGILLETDFGSTARMAKLVQEGSSCDVFIGADMSTPQKFVDSGRAKNIIPFVRNDMVAVSQKSLRLKSETLCTFLSAADHGKIGISDPETQPCGANAVKALSQILPERTINTITHIVTGGLGKKKEKAAGEKSDYTASLEKDTDLLLVFRTTAQKVCNQLTTAEIIELPSCMATTAQYGMVILNDAPDCHSLANYLQTQKAKQIFESYGFK